MTMNSTVFHIFFIMAICLASMPCMASDIIIGATEPWAPYMDPSLEGKGIICEIFMEALKVSGHESRVEFMPWPRAMYNVRYGTNQALLGAYYSDERNQFFAFSEPILKLKDALFKLKGKKIRFSKIRDLKPYRIGVVDGALHGKEFDEADYLNKEIVYDKILNIKKLLKGRLDLIAGPKDVIQYTFKKMFSKANHQIEPVGPPIGEHFVYVAFSRSFDDCEKLRDDFNQGMSILRQNGMYDEILNRHDRLLEIPVGKKPVSH